MDGPRDLSYRVKPVRVKAKDDIQGESINSSRELIHKLRQTHRRRNTSVQFFLSLGKGNNKRLGLTDTHYLLSDS